MCRARMCVCRLQQWAVNALLTRGVPRDKLVVGIPTYGRTFKLASSSNFGLDAPATPGQAPTGRQTGESGFLAYYEVDVVTFTRFVSLAFFVATPTLTTSLMRLGYCVLVSV